MKKLLFLLPILILFTQCKKDQESDNNSTNNLSGLGNMPGTPTGTQFNLPDHILLLQEIRGGEYGFGKTQKIKKENRERRKTNFSDDWDIYGSGNYVELYMKLYNTRSTATNLTIPGKLIFIDTKATPTSLGIYQNGFILQDVELTLPPNDTSFIVIQAYCLNEGLEASDDDAIFNFGPLTNNQNLSRVVSIMETKQTNLTYYEIDYIQEIIWDITDYNLDLTSSQIDFLNELP